MGRASEYWDKLAQARSDEVCRALIRTPVMTRGQIARLLGLRVQQAHNLVRRKWQVLHTQPYIPRKHHSTRYPVSNRTKVLVRLSDEALKDWSGREGLKSRNYVSPRDVGRVLRVADVLIALRSKRLLYDLWDLILPQNETDGLHAWLVKRGDESGLLGLYVLPLSIEARYEGQRGRVMQGIIRRVTQNAHTTRTLFLVASENYTYALRVMVSAKEAGHNLYLLPFESFLADPLPFLTAIHTGEHANRKELIDNMLDWDEKYPVPAPYAFPALLGFEGGLHRFVDSYRDGSVDRVRIWTSKEYRFGYQMPRGGLAGADVYVRDTSILAGLDAVFKHYDTFIEAKPWPMEVDSMTKPRGKM